MEGVAQWESTSLAFISKAPGSIPSTAKPRKTSDPICIKENKANFLISKT